MRVASGQFSAVSDPHANLATIEGLMEEASARGADLLVLPEMSLHASSAPLRELSSVAQPLGGPFITGVADASRRMALPVVVGTIEKNPAGLPFNTVVSIGIDGQITGTYRKIHLYDAFGYSESTGITPGNPENPFIIENGPFKIGVFTCYDLRFPESARRVVDAGANVLLVPALWVPGPGKEDQWNILLRARAIENTAYLVSANQSAPRGTGYSLIVDPAGVVIANAGEAEGIVLAELGANRLHEVRHKNPSLLNRRFTTSPQRVLPQQGLI